MKSTNPLSARYDMPAVSRRDDLNLLERSEPVVFLSFVSLAVLQLPIIFLSVYFRSENR